MWPRSASSHRLRGDLRVFSEIEPTSSGSSRFAVIAQKVSANAVPVDTILSNATHNSQ